MILKDGEDRIPLEKLGPMFTLDFEEWDEKSAQEKEKFHRSYFWILAFAFNIFK